MNHFARWGDGGFGGPGGGLLGPFDALALSDYHGSELIHDFPEFTWKASPVDDVDFPLDELSQYRQPENLRPFLWSTDHSPCPSPALAVNQAVTSALALHGRMPFLDLDLQGISLDPLPCQSTDNFDPSQVSTVADIPLGSSHMAAAQGIADNLFSDGFDFSAPMEVTAAWTQSLGLNLSIGSWSPTSSLGVSSNDMASDPVPSPKRGPKHTGSFRCSEPGCNTVWASRTKLSQHKRCHRKEFSCRQSGGSCDQLFSTRPELRRHLRHENGDILVCQIPGCKRPKIKGGRKDNLRRHLKNVHHKLSL